MADNTSFFASKLIIGMVVLGLALGGLGVVIWFSLFPPHLDVPPQEDRVISGVTIVNPGVSRALDQSIVVKGGRIVEERPRSSTDPAPDCKGCFALPGLIDAHVHTPPSLAFGNQELFSLMYLAYGVTSVRDVGSVDDSVGALRARLNSGRLVGPHMYWCGQVLESPPLSFGAARAVANASEASAAVDELAQQGVDCIKIYNNLNLDAYRGVREAAARHKLPVIGHVPHLVGIANMRDFESQHITGIPYVRGGSPPINGDYRDVDWLSMTDAEIDKALIEARNRNISFLPTLANGRLRLIASDPQRFPPTPGRKRLPEVWTSAWQSQTTIASHPTGDGIGLRQQRIPRLAFVAGRARALGIDILAGTDTLMPYVVPGEALHFEVSDLAGAFADTEAALAAATTVNGRHIDPGVVGTIAVGARADILLLPADPTSDLSAVGKWRTLYADGRRYERAALDRALDAFERHFHSTIYATVMSLAADSASAGKGRPDDHAH